jgi:type I restriction enzyme S subunit
MSAIVRLSDVCALDKQQGQHAGLPYLGLEHIESGTGKFDLSPDNPDARSSTFRFSSKHVLYGRLRPYLKKVALPERDGRCSTEIFPILPKDGVDRRYLSYWFLSDATTEAINATCTGARMPRANMDAVLELPILAPPLGEQHRIVALLDEAFAGIAIAKANAEKSLRNARGVSESISQQVLDSAGGDDVSLESVAADDCSLSYGIVQPGNDVEGGLPVVRPVDLTRNVITLDGLKRIDPELALGYERTKLQGGELLLCVRGTTGTVSIAAPELEGGNVTRGIVPIRFKSDRVIPSFGYHLIKSGGVQSQIRERTYGAALMQINIGDLRNIKVKIPPLSEQNELAERLDNLRKGAAHLQSLYTRKLAALDELKQSLLQRAFSGQL